MLGCSGLLANGVTVHGSSQYTWLVAAAAAQQAGRAVALDLTRTPHDAASHLADAWTALVLATWPHEPVPGDMQLIDCAETLLLRGGASSAEVARNGAQLLALLRARRRRPWADPAAALRRGEVEEHATRLGRLIDRARMRLGIGAAAPMAQARPSA